MAIISLGGELAKRILREFYKEKSSGHGVPIAILENNREKNATFLSRCGYLSVCVVNETCLTRKTAL